MKKYILLASALTAWTALRAQQFTVRTNAVVEIPPVIWRGSNAQVIASQILALTNTDGSLVIPPGLFTNRTADINIRVDAGTNGTLRSIRATVR